MSEIGYNRCPNDDWKAGSAPVGANPETGQPVELNINGISAAMGIQAALLTLSAAMKAGHEEDFLAKVALCLFSKLGGDPHALCPLTVVLSMCLFLLTGEAVVSFSEEGHLLIGPPDHPEGACENLCAYHVEGGETDEPNEGPEAPMDPGGLEETGGNGGTDEKGDNDGIHPTG